MINRIIILLVLGFTLCLGNTAFSQQEDDFDGAAGEVKEVQLASGGTVQCKCGGKVPFKKIKEKGTFSSVVIDPETDQIQISVEVEGETNKNILELELSADVNPCTAVDKFLKRKNTDTDLDSFMIDLARTNKATGEEINVTNEIRQQIESGSIDVDVDEAIRGQFKLKSFKDNLASGLIKVNFTNTGKIVETASELTGEDIQVDENGKVKIVCKFTDIPINGSFLDLSCIDSASLPGGISLEDLPDGIDLSNLPPGIDLSNVPDGIDLSDLNDLPPGFDLGDVLELPDGFNISDLGKIPPWLDIEDLDKLPEGFSLDDLASIPPSVDINNLPPGFTLEDLVGVPFGIDISNLPPGTTPDDLKDLPPGLGPNVDPSTIDPSVVCEDGAIKPSIAPFVPEGIKCPAAGVIDLPPGVTEADLEKLPPGVDISSIPTDLLIGLINGTAQPCLNGAIIPGFESTVPEGFDCSTVQ